MGQNSRIALGEQRHIRNGDGIVSHIHVPSVFFHLVVFGEQVGDVLCGGQARLILLGAYPVVECQGNLSAEILGIGHRVVLLSHLLTQV